MKEVRLRSPKPYATRSNINKYIMPKKKFLLVVEGSKTEIDYFNGIFNYRKELKISTLVDVIVLERVAKNRTDSHPKHLLSGIIRKIEEEPDAINYNKDIDEIWLIFDRDPSSLSVNQFYEIYSECKKRRFFIGFTNPNFEFWLLLHLPNIEQYDRKQLLENRKITKKRRFIEIELSKRLNHGYNKRNIKFERFKSGVNLAIHQEKLFSNSIEAIVYELGSNIGTLIQKMRE